MKARKIDLKNIPLFDDRGGLAYQSYRECLQAVISAPGKEGMSSDDVLKACDFKIALAQSEDALYVQQEDYAWLLTRLNKAIKWTCPTNELAQFIRDTRTAPLVDMTERQPGDDA